MSSPETDPGVIRLLLDWAWAGVLALSAILYRNNREELKTVKEALERTITREEFRRHEDREDKDRDERREAENSLLARLDKLETRLDQKMTFILDRLVSK